MGDQADIILTVDREAETLALTGDTPEFRKALGVTLETPDLTAAQAVLRFYYRGTCVFALADWTVDGTSLVGAGSLNTTELEAAFEGRASDAIIPLKAKLFNGDTQEVVAEGRIACRNNPPGVYDDPEEVPPISGDGTAIQRERFTLTATEIDRKYIRLTREPNGDYCEVLVVNGPQAVVTDDFVLQVGRKVSWDGLGLDGVLASGDVLSVAYSYEVTAETPGPSPSPDGESSVPTGGTVGQVLVKVSEAPGDTEWVDPSALAWPTADGASLADADRFAVGQYAAGVWSWVAKTGTQLKAWLKTYFDEVYAAASHTHSYLTQAAADLLYAAASHTHAYLTQAAADLLYDAIGAGAAAQAAAIAASTPAAHASAANPHSGSAGSGANSDILSLSGLTTALSVAQGGTGATTAAAARSAVGAAPLAAVRHVFWPAGAAIPRTTNGAASATIEAATNDVMYDVFDFDSATSEGVAWVGYLEHWNAGTIKAKLVWTYAGSPSGTNVQWSVAGRAYANDDAIDQAAGTAQVISDDKIAAGDIHITGATPAIALGGSPANGQAIILQVTRDVGNDDLAADARLLGVWIEYTEAATEEAAW